MPAKNLNFVNDLSKREFKKIKSLVYENIGVFLTESKIPMIKSRLSKRLRELEYQQVSNYLDYIEENSEELELLFNSITTNVTHFFREDYHFEFLKHRYLPKLGSKAIRIWSAGCSTGEEPYSIAIVMEEFTSGRDMSYKILASDINTEVLKTAYQGIYSSKQIEKVPYKLLKKYFKTGTGENEGLFKVKDILKANLFLKKINLNDVKKYPIEKPLDIIFCRNVFIYFDNQTREKILGAFHRFLKPGGVLFLGHSEKISLDKLYIDRWQQIEPTIYRRVY